MKQLTLTKNQLERIGFVKKIYDIPYESNSKQTIYRIKCLNGYFFYNYDNEVYRWYQRIDIEGKSNHICLDVHDPHSLFTLLRSFKVKHTFFVILN